MARCRDLKFLGVLAVAACGGTVVFDEELPGEGGGTVEERIQRGLESACRTRCSTPECQATTPEPVEECTGRCVGVPEACSEEILAYNECIVDGLCDGSICLDLQRAGAACLEEQGLDEGGKR